MMQLEPIAIAPVPELQAPIPFNRACLGGREQEYILSAVAKGHISGDGPFTRRCQTWIEEQLTVRKALLTTSCTDALELAAMLLDFSPGDEVIVPSYTFVSTANAFVTRGARPVFGDIRPDTLNIDERRVEELITARTRALVVVHYAGVGCEMDSLLQIAKRHNLVLIEDNAHGLLGTYRGQKLGSFGALATQSFHETKNFSCGEGGALCINDSRYLERAEILREKGTNRSRFFRGQTDKYTWVDVGSSFLPSDLLAAFLCGQFEAAGQIQAQRRRVWQFYWEHLGQWASESGVHLPHVPEYCDHPSHMFYLLMPSLAQRQAFIAHLKALEILSVFHYVPLHLSPMGQKFGGKPGDCPVTEKISDRLVRLPFYADLTEADQRRVVSAVKSFPFERAK